MSLKHKIILQRRVIMVILTTDVIGFEPFTQGGIGSGNGQGQGCASSGGGGGGFFWDFQRP